MPVRPSTFYWNIIGFGIAALLATLSVNFRFLTQVLLVVGLLISLYSQPLRLKYHIEFFFTTFLFTLTIAMLLKGSRRPLFHSRRILRQQQGPTHTSIMLLGIWFYSGGRSIDQRMALVEDPALMSWFFMC